MVLRLSEWLGKKKAFVNVRSGFFCVVFSLGNKTMDVFYMSAKMHLM